MNILKRQKSNEKLHQRQKSSEKPLVRKDTLPKADHLERSRKQRNNERPPIQQHSRNNEKPAVQQHSRTNSRDLITVDRPAVQQQPSHRSRDLMEQAQSTNQYSTTFNSRFGIRCFHKSSFLTLVRTLPVVRN